MRFAYAAFVVVFLACLEIAQSMLPQARRKSFVKLACGRHIISRGTRTVRVFLPSCLSEQVASSSKKHLHI